MQGTAHSFGSRSRSRGSIRRALVVLFIVAAALVSVGAASAACDVRTGSQFSNSNPLVNVTANTTVQPTLHVNGDAWFYLSGPTSVSGGYYKTAFDYVANSYTGLVGTYVSVEAYFSSGICAGAHWGTIYIAP